MSIGKEEKIDVIVVYNNSKIKEVVEELRELMVANIERGEAILIVGDFNARIGSL